MSWGHTFEGYALFWTNSAVLFQSHYWEGAIWLPRSQVYFHDPDLDTPEMVVTVKNWLCQKNGFGEFMHIGEAEIERINDWD